MEGTLKINLKGTEVKVEEPKNWLQKIGSKLFGKKEYEVENVTQLQYLERIYKIFTAQGYNNVLSLSVNDEIVYEEEEYTKDDFKIAIESAYKKVQEKDFYISFDLQNNEEENDDIINVEFASKHEVGNYPLTITVDLDKSAEDIEKLLNELKDKINAEFGIESGYVEVDSDYEDDEEESEDDEDLDDEEDLDEDSEEEEEED